ncbi:hypothetical protein F5Y04DRAFT_144928 [Hypomontagnella monticulosa]|nr:hypothetical protein F5Y04DRAFT_144928 [Hypomontagnella monticulosa]
MATNDPSSHNPFIRFKNHVDSNIQRGFEAIFGSLATMGAQDSSNMPPNGLDNVPSHPIEPDSPSSSSEGPCPDTHENNVDADTVFDWAISSPYSPFNLQSLRQPRPRDAPHNYPDCFTFRDAFEDLLAVNTGQPLSDLQKLVFAKHRENFRYFWGMPVDDWVTGIGRRGLWGAYFPLSSSATRELSYGLISPWRRLQMGDMTFRQPQALSWPMTAFPPWEHHKSGFWHHGWHGCNEKSSRHQRHEVDASRSEEADSEGDLYAAVKSDFATDDTAREVNVQSASSQNVDPPNPEKGSTTQTIETTDGGKILKTVQKHVDGHMTEVTTTTQQFNADGKLVARSEETTRTWSRTYPERFSSDTESTDGEGDTTRKDGKPGGWFWTK